MIIPFPPNVVGSRGEPFEAHAETLFLSRVFEHLRAEMGGRFEEFTFVVHRRKHFELAGYPIPLDQGCSGKILIVISDEGELFPVEEFSSYPLIFRAYGAQNPAKPTVHEFPVGYYEAAGHQEPVKFSEREISVFFSGFMNGQRVNLFKQFRRVFWLPRKNLGGRKPQELARRIINRFYKEKDFAEAYPGAYLRFTDGFAKGMEPLEYARTLANAKIAICPPGFYSHETIRHWEAMRLGCVIISAPLPPSHFYAGSPIIELRDWSELDGVIVDLLSDPERMASIHEAMTEWWKLKCQESAVAKRMAEVILG